MQRQDQRRLRWSKLLVWDQYRKYMISVWPFLHNKEQLLQLIFVQRPRMVCFAVPSALWRGMPSKFAEAIKLWVEICAVLHILVCQPVSACSGHYLILVCLNDSKLLMLRLGWKLHQTQCISSATVLFPYNAIKLSNLSQWSSIGVILI